MRSRDRASPARHFQGEEHEPTTGSATDRQDGVSIVRDEETRLRGDHVWFLHDQWTDVELIVGRRCFRLWHMLHDRYLFSLLDDMHVVSRSRHVTYEHNPGEVATCEPGDIHTNVSVRGGGDFTALFVPKALVEEHLGIRDPHFTFNAPGRLEAGFAIRAYFALLKGAASRLEREEALLAVVRTAYGTHGQRVYRPPLRSASGAVRRCREILHSRVGEDIRLDELAGETGLAKPSIVRAFKREMGMTPGAYLMHLRVNQAKSLLAQGMSAIDACGESGFYDQSHMNRWFKKVLGVTPGQYLNAVRG